MILLYFFIFFTNNDDINSHSGPAIMSNDKWLNTVMLISFRLKSLGLMISVLVQLTETSVSLNSW